MTAGELHEVMPQGIEQYSLDDLYEIYTAGCNHELRAALLADMRPFTAYGTTALHRVAMDMMGNEPVWEGLGSATVRDYAIDSFTPVGLVEKKPDPVTSWATFELTELGRFVQALAGHNLHLSLDMKPSLQEVYGPRKTNSECGSRPIKRRLEVLRVVAKTKSVPEAEIATEIGMEISHLDTVVDDLANSGLIQRNSIGRGNPHKTFVATAKFHDYQIRSHTKPFLKNIIQVLDQHFTSKPGQPVSLKQIEKFLLELPDYDKPEDFEGKLSSKIQQLVRYSGILEAISANGENRNRGIILADEEQLRLINKILSLFDRARQPDQAFIAEGLAKAQAILADPAAVNLLVGKAKRAATGLKVHQLKETIGQRILLNLALAGGPLTARETRNSLQATGEKLDKGTVKGYLGKLAKAGKIDMIETPQGHAFTVYS